MRKVNVFDGNDVIAIVNYNNKLDYWDGNNWYNGGVGHHLGITKLRDGRIVLIHGSDWQGTRDVGIVVSKVKALNSILLSGNEEILDDPKFSDLKDMYHRIEKADIPEVKHIIEESKKEKVEKQAGYNEKDIIDAIMCWWAAGYFTGSTSSPQKTGNTQMYFSSKKRELEEKIGRKLPDEMDSNEALSFLIIAAQRIPGAVWKTEIGEV